jgi:hypothetical protein
VSVFDVYRSRITARGGNKRNAALIRKSRYIDEKLSSSLSYHQVAINGNVENVAILNHDNLDMKTICSLPGQDLPHGGLVEWMDNRWLIIERDANNELYTRGVMRQCNYILRWVTDDNIIVERWCVVEDGTKYLTGEYGDNNYIITRGDSRISLTIAKDEHTVKLGRNNRFLIDDYDSPEVLAYRLSKPFKLGGSFDNIGVFHFVLQECNTEDTDNKELHIANYYDHFPYDIPTEPEQGGETPPSEEASGRRVWL